MATSTYTDSNGYVWTAELNTDDDPHRINAGETITVTAPRSGEVRSFSVNEVFNVTDGDPNSAARAAADQQGTSGYPTTKDEQAFIDGCNETIHVFNEIVNEGSSIAAEAAAVEQWVEKAAEVAKKLWFIPVVGIVIAGVGAAVEAVDKKFEQCTNELVAVIQKVAQADLGLQSLRDDMANHAITLEDAEDKIKGVEGNVTSFWQALETAVKACV